MVGSRGANGRGEATEESINWRIEEKEAISWDEEKVAGFC